MPNGIGKNTTKRPPDGGVICAYAANNRAILESPLQSETTQTKNAPVPTWNGGEMQQYQILPYRSVAVRIFWASSSVAKPGLARQVQLAEVKVPGWFMRPSRPISR